MPPTGIVPESATEPAPPLLVTVPEIVVPTSPLMAMETEVLSALLTKVGTMSTVGAVGATVSTVKSAADSALPP